MRLIYSIILALLSVSCAQFIPPTGGPKDEDPPELVHSSPSNKTINFQGSTIELEFNELIDATSLRQELIITPSPDSPYDVRAKAYSLEIKFDKPFRDSTTYTFNFRNGVKDLNEKNPAKNLKLVFSTGSEIDSLTLGGRITDLWTSRNAEETLVGLYDLNSKDTIPLLDRKPNYFIKTDTSGLYQFENIKSSKYRLLAFEDKNLNLLFDSKTEKFGFLPDTINLDSSIVTNINFSIYPYNTNPPRFQRTLSRQSNYSITFDKGIKDIQVNFLKQNDSLTYQIRDKELLFFNHPFTADTILTNIVVIDSAENTVEKEQKIYFNTSLKSNTKPERLNIYSPHISNNTTIRKPNYYDLQFDYPISNVDTSKIKILADTTTYEIFTSEWLDKSQTKLRINFTSSARQELKLSIDEGSIKSYKSDSNSTYQLINKLYQQDIYGSISGTYTQFEGSKIIQILDYKTLKVIDSQEFTKDFSFKEVLPGTYRLRIIQDSNNNKQWDTANFELNMLPEPIVVSKGILKLKSNFHLDQVVID